MLIHSYSADESRDGGRGEKVSGVISLGLWPGHSRGFFNSATQRLRGSQLEGLSWPFKRQIMFLFS